MKNIYRVSLFEYKYVGYLDNAFDERIESDTSFIDAFTDINVAKEFIEKNAQTIVNRICWLCGTDGVNFVFSWEKDNDNSYTATYEYEDEDISKKYIISLFISENPLREENYDYNDHFKIK